MARLVLAVVLAFGLVTAGAQARSDEKTLNEILPEVSLGDPNAPVTIYEHSSLTCSHCADFHNEILPQIKKDYIDSGKARLVLRDFPLGQLAMVAAMLPHCAGPDRAFGFVEVLFRTQKQWAFAQNPGEGLQRVMRMGGMDKAAFEACLQKREIYDAIRERAMDDQTLYGIDATPTFRIGKEQFSGALPYEDFRKYIDEALEAKK